MRGFRLLAVLLLAFGAVAVTIAQDDRPRGFRPWFNAVTTHVPGELDEAVVALGSWSFSDLVGVLPEMRSLAWSERARLIERGLVLHTDIAVLNRDNTGYRLPAGVNGATLVDDGRAVGQMTGTDHWDFARRLINDIPEQIDRIRIARRFYRATAAALQQWGEYPELTLHLAAGRRVIGDDAVLLLYEGTTHQAYAGPRMQRFFDDRRRQAAKGPVAMRTLPPGAGGGGQPIPELPPSFPSVRDSRSRAERLFRRALTLDASLSEARIRLAHVLGDRGRHDEAVAELKRIAGRELPAFLDYYAAILTARESRARGDLATARAAFERAADRYPSASVPRLGLSELAMATGDREASLAHLVTEAATTPEAMAEPWWWIDRVHEPSAAILIAELRQTAPQ